MATASLALIAAVSVSGCKYLFPAATLMREARELESVGDFQGAAATYERLIRRYPEKPQAMTALSRVAVIYEEKIGNWKKAAMFLQELRERTKGEQEHALVLLRLGRVLECGGTPYMDAIEAYGAVCQDCGDNPESVTALLALGRIHEAVKEWPAAKLDYEMAIKKLGNAPQAETVRTRLQSVWLLEALGAYFSGRIEEAAELASAALARIEAVPESATPSVAPAAAIGISVTPAGAASATALEESVVVALTVPEVRRGLEDLMRRYRDAKKLWKADVGTLILEDSVVADSVDLARFMIRAEKGQTYPGPQITATALVSSVPKDPPAGLQKPPEGIRIVFNEKRRTFVLEEEPEPGAKAKKKPWRYASSPNITVLGFWFSPDGKWLGWIGRLRSDKSLRINIMDLKKHSVRRVIYDPSGDLLGDVMLFLPNCEKIVFPYRSYLAMSDLRGANRVNFLLRSGSPPGAAGKVFRYHGGQVEWLACSADGLEVAVAVGQRGRGPVIWKLGLGAGGG